MNYFEFYPGDYLRDTSDLSVTAHGAYMLLMATYYANERPLSPDVASLARIARAVSKVERAELMKIITRYFVLCDDGLLHNFRADREIAKARKRIDIARENGKKGGRKVNPAGNPAGNPTLPLRVNPEGYPDPSPEITQPGEALHTPHAMLQEKAYLPPADAVGVNGHDLLGDPAIPVKRNPVVPYEKIRTLYHEILCPPLPTTNGLDDDRRKHIRARCQNELPDLESWRDYFEDVKRSNWLMGRVPGREGKPFRCTFDYLINAKNFRKISEGNYHDE